jgi:hypothetical protein
MDRLPIVLLHGYSAEGPDFDPWRNVLQEEGYDPLTIHIGDYVTLSNEITIKDIAEGFDRALREQEGLKNGERFDAIVHSTGSLVIREWLVSYSPRQKRLGRLIGLAPANFGSPLAHRGQSWTSVAFKGNRKLGPDFMETGHQVLSGLELGSRYTWELAHKDLLNEEPIFDETPDSPFPFVLIGEKDYGLATRFFIGDPGSDGTVRWAGADMNTRRIELDLTREPGDSGQGKVHVPRARNIQVPFTLVPDLNHGTIVSDPSPALVEMVTAALRVEDIEQYRAWAEKYSTMAGGRLDQVEKDWWQQFVVRVVDERGDPVPDYYIEFAADGAILEDFSKDVHTFIEDESFRCFHVNLSDLRPEQRDSLELRVVARSGTELVAYHGTGSEVFSREGEPLPEAENEDEESLAWDARRNLTPWLREKKVKFFFPYTTTLVEIKLNREPMPAIGVSEIMKFLKPNSGAEDATS